MAGPSVDTFRQRITRAQQEMARQGLDWLFIGPGPDLVYLVGFDAHLSERLNLLGIPREGKPFLVVPLLEAPTVTTARELADLLVWPDGASPIDQVTKGVGDAQGRRIGVGDHLWSGFLLRLQEGLPGVQWTTGQPVMRDLRVTKDQAEVDLLAEASRLTDDAWHEFVEGGAISGLTEAEASARLGALLEKRGLTVAHGICASGPNSASPHHHTSDRVIEPGDVVIFDFGGTLGGYHSDVTRTVVIGEPTPEYRHVYEIVKRANQATLDAVRPGLPCEDLDKVARGIITDAGYGPNFLHRVGHGLGLEVHEDPYLVNGNTTPLAPGMVFSDEPGIYLEGRFGIRIEDSVVCTETGGKRLNEANREITVMD